MNDRSRFGREASIVLCSWFGRLLPAPTQFRCALMSHFAGRLTGAYSTISADVVLSADRAPLLIHFWTPQAWPSAAIHVERMLPQLRAQAAALGLPWRITNGPELPDGAVDWLLCLKAVPPRRNRTTERTVLLLNDDGHRVWGHLGRFDHIVVVSSPILASLVGSAHPRVWFIEETEPTDRIEQGAQALERSLPSQRAPILLWHGTRDSLDGLYPLRGALEAFAEETGAELWIVTNAEEKIEHWRHLRIQFMPWSEQALVAAAARARIGIVPARPTLADSYLKSAGRLRCLFALGCPAIGDARSPDVVDFSRTCGLPYAHASAEWLAALHDLWGQSDRLDDAARRGHALVRDRFSTDGTAAQWLRFLTTAETSVARTNTAPAD